jgi:hypothetical protein
MILPAFHEGSDQIISSRLTAIFLPSARHAFARAHNNEDAINRYTP